MTEGRTRRGSNQPRLTLIFWRDIPAQVKAKSGRSRVSAPLSDRFMIAVDAAATKAGKTSTDDYIAEWREEGRPCGEDLQSEVDEAVRLVEAAYPPDLIKSYVRNEGWAPGREPGDSASESP